MLESTATQGGPIRLQLSARPWSVGKEETRVGTTAIKDLQSLWTQLQTQRTFEQSRTSAKLVTLYRALHRDSNNYMRFPEGFPNEPHILEGQERIRELDTQIRQIETYLKEFDPFIRRLRTFGVNSEHSTESYIHLPFIVDDVAALDRDAAYFARASHFASEVEPATPTVPGEDSDKENVMPLTASQVKEELGSKST